MEPIRLRLDLSRHCVQTAIRKRYNQLVGEALRSPSSSQRLESEIELLKTALETFDFGYMRMTYPPLAGHGSERVELEEKTPGRPLIKINGKPVSGPDRSGRDDL